MAVAPVMLRRQVSVKGIRRSSLASPASIAGLMLATVAVGYLIGVVAAPQGESFAWEPAAVAATAFATAILAGFTATVAAATSKDLRTRERVCVVVRSAAAHQQRPGAQAVCEVTLRNTGAASANYITVKVDGEDDAGVPFVGTSTCDHFLNPGEEAVIGVELAPADQREADLRHDIVMRVRGVCLDVLDRPQYFLWQVDRDRRTFYKLTAEPWPI